MCCHRQGLTASWSWVRRLFVASAALVRIFGQTQMCLPAMQPVKKSADYSASGRSSAFSVHAARASSPIKPKNGHGVPAISIALKTRRSWQRRLTAATRIPISYRVLDSFIRSQFWSRTVRPADRPMICVCTAPDCPVVQRSWLYDIIDGAMALGGGDLMFWSII